MEQKTVKNQCENNTVYNVLVPKLFTSMLPHYFGTM